MRRLILVGLDGLGFETIGQWKEEGYLPTLAYLIKEGVSGDLEALPPPYTASSWPTIMTGRDLDKHGVFDFFGLKGNDYAPRLANSLDVKAPFLWEYLSHAGLSSIVINVPMTYPPRAMRGILVPGYGAPEAPDCLPSTMFTELTSALGGYRIYSETELDPWANFEGHLEGFLEVSRMRRDAALYLGRRYDWQLLVVVFQKTDGVFHLMNRHPRKDPAMVRSFLATIDQFVGDILELDSEADVMVVSDHGMGLSQWTFAINNWLKEQGVLVTKTGQSEDFDIDHEISKGSKAEGRPVKPRIIDAIFQSSAAIGLSRQRVERALKSLKLLGIAHRFLPVGRTVAGVPSEQVDWGHSRAFCFYPSGFGVKINLRGREAKGIIQPGKEYRRLRDRLIAQLQGLRDPEGMPVFDFVGTPEAVYDGPFLEGLPDILIRPRDMEYRIEKRIRGDSFIRNYQYYSHKMHGIFMASGPSFRHRAVEWEATPRTCDVAPTILHLMGFPVDSGMDGRVLTEILVDGERQRKVAYDPYGSLSRPAANRAFSDAEQQQIETRLRGLGYLD